MELVSLALGHLGGEVMNVAAITALLTALAIILPLLGHVLNEIRKLRSEYKMIWHGIVARGFIEAYQGGYIEYTDGGWQSSQPARGAYQPITGELRALYTRLLVNGDRPPSDDEFAAAAEKTATLRDWMLNHACPELRLNRHGCLAIAIVIARE